MNSSNSTRRYGLVLLSLALALAGCSAPAAGGSTRPGGRGTAAAAGATSEAAPAASASPQQPTPMPVTGLLVASIPSGNSAEVDAIDPSTGASQTVASFASPDSTVFIDPSIVAMTYGSSPMHRAMFSPDFKRVVAVKKTPDGPNHVGWLDTSGQFTDVTAASGEPSGFTTVGADDTPMFGTDGTFYFARREAGGDWKGTPTIMKVAPGSAGPATTAKAFTSNDGVNYFVNPGGEIIGVCGGCGTFQENGGGVGGFVVQDWISPREYVAIDSSHSGIYRVKGKPEAESSLLDSPTDGVALLPHTNRSVSDAVVSPDKSQVAFLSTAPGSSAVEVYTVSAAGGGAPQKVPTTAVADKEDLIGWR